MKNPLRKRYLRELKSDFGKYLVIALFMIMLIGAVSGYLVAANSIETTFYEGVDKYNLEDGHIVFSKVPEASLLEEIEEKGDLKLYDLEYVEEDTDSEGTTLRIFRKRTDINTECLMEGAFPEGTDEIAVDRLYAQYHDLSIGDTIPINGKDIKISGLVALVDYGCLFENNSDMMFSIETFGVGVMTDEGYDALNSAHVYNCYAWKYNTPCKDETEKNSRSEDLMDVLEDVIKKYDTSIVQAEVDDLYAEANELSDELQAEFDNATDEIKEKTEKASKDAATKAVNSLTTEDKMTLFMQGASNEDYVKYAAEKQGTTIEGLVAKELGTTLEALEDFEDAVEDIESKMDSVGADKEAPVISLDDDEEYENDMDFSLDEIRDIVDKLDKTGLYDVKNINSILDELEGLMDYEFDEEKLLDIDGYQAEYDNKAINYCMDDMGGDKPMFILFDYIVVVIIAFVFAVTISNTIAKEAGVIGTLRASGYTRGELTRHYLFMPLLVTVIASIIGNILGYTVFVEMMKEVFYNSFSLATYESLFNSEAFMYTTVIPLILMIIINLVTLTTKLKLSPIKFLRHELAAKKKRRAVLLNKKWPFLTRFRLRILFQNIPAYITLAFGIFFGGVICVFGLMFGPLLTDFGDLIVEEKISDYQYVLMDQIETETEGAEKYCITGLDSMMDGYLTDEVSIYGIEEDSSYITKDIPEGEVLVSEGILKKYGLNKGDTLTLKDQYSDKTYDFKIADTYSYSASLAVFMNRNEFNECFDEEDDYFTGYFSNNVIEDIESDDVATVITASDLKKVADQLNESLGSFMVLFKYFGVIMLVLLIYLMTKQVIEKNMQSIAMTKILGFRNKEISGLYLVITCIVVVVSLIVSIPLIDIILRLMFEKYLYTEISGYIPYIVDKMCYVWMTVFGILSFVFVAVFMMVKISRIEKSEALKNVE